MLVNVTKSALSPYETSMYTHWQIYQEKTF